MLDEVSRYMYLTRCIARYMDIMNRYILPAYFYMLSNTRSCHFTKDISCMIISYLWSL